MSRSSRRRLKQAKAHNEAVRKASQQAQLSAALLVAKRGYRLIDDDPLADAIWQFWHDIGFEEKYLPGSLASSYHLAQYLRDKGLTKVNPMSTNEETKKFQLGDEVTWTSQAAGTLRTKTGKIVEVVRTGDRPTRMRNTGIDRRHESYVIEVPGKTPRQKTKLYWPRVSQLTLVVKPADDPEPPKAEGHVCVGNGCKAWDCDKI